MDLTTIIKKRTKMFAISTILIVFIVCSTFFAFRKSNVKDIVLINNKSIKVTLMGEKTLRFADSPMNFQEGVVASPSNIYKIVNKSKLSTNYRVVVTEISQELDKSELNKIAVSLNGDVKLLSDVLDGIVYENSLEPGNEDIVDLKIWFNKDAITEQDKNRELNLKVDFKEI